MEKLIVYRGEAKNYHAESDEFIPSIRRGIDISNAAEFESKHINGLYSGNISLPFFRNIDISKTETEKLKNQFKVLAIMQHYGFGTQLIDVTSSKDIATYFACCEHFDDAGYVYEFNVKKMKTFDTKTVERRMSIIWNNKIDAETSYHKSTFEDVVAFDYCKEFFTDSDCIRYTNQKGYFLLTGYKKISDRIIPLNIGKNYVSQTTEISADKKILTLLELANKGVHYAFIYPDEKKSIILKRQYLDYTLCGKSLINDWVNSSKGKYQNLLREILREIESFNQYAYFETSVREYIECNDINDDVKTKNLKDVLKCIAEV